MNEVTPVEGAPDAMRVERSHFAEWTSAARERVRGHGLDAALVGLAVLFAWVTLFYPFGRDQGLYYYVGREWALRGSVPYRDVLDHKTPGIYVVHALVVLVFGEHLWGIRVAEIVCVVALGLAVVGLTTERGRRPTSGLRGLGVLLTSVLYFGFLDFRETGEGELWLSMFALAGAWAIRRGLREPRAQLACGALSAAATLMKPSAVFFVLVTFLVLVRRAWETPGKRALGLIRGAAIFGAGFGAVWASILGYFAIERALPALYDVVVGANAYYVVHEASAKSLYDVAIYTRGFVHWYAPFTYAGIAFGTASLVLAVVRRDGLRLVRHLLGAAFCVAAWLSVAVQGRFFPGHCGVMAGPLALVLMNVVVDAIAWLAGRARAERRERVVALGVAASVLTSFVGYATADFVSERYLRIQVDTLRWLGGSLSRDAYMAHYVEHGLAATARENELAGAWVRDHSVPEDFVAVRGFQPQVYAVARRRYSGRFFWTTFIVADSRAYRREEWLAEDRAALSKNPPRYVVTLSKVTGTDGADWWTRFGYTQRVVFGDLVVLERTPESATERL